MRPMKRAGALPSVHLEPGPKGASPNAMTRAADATGSIAAVPGNGVELLIRKAESTTPPIPSQAPATRRASGRRRSAETASATTPPTANSQPRVKVEKYAVTEEEVVACT